MERRRHICVEVMVEAQGIRMVVRVERSATARTWSWPLDVMGKDAKSMEMFVNFSKGKGNGCKRPGGLPVGCFIAKQRRQDLAKIWTS